MPLARRSVHPGLAAAATVVATCALLAGAPDARAQTLSAFGPCKLDRAPPERVAAKVQCAVLTLPETAGKARGRALALPVLRIPAETPSGQAPVFVLNGGPGSRNLNTIRAFPGVERTRDVYYVGYRGADDALRLDCPEVTPHLGAPEVLAPANLERLTAATRACAARWRREGVDLSSYSMLDVIRDLEATRTALGVPKVNLVSSSYGTRLAQYYARLHPERIARSVMFGANPPGHFVFSSYANDKAIARLSDRCAQDPACAAQTLDLRATLLRALDTGAAGRAAGVDDGKTQLALFTALYNRNTSRMMVAAAIAAEAGDYSKLKQFGDMAVAGARNTIWGEMMSKGMVDHARYHVLESTFRPRGTSMGSPLDLVFHALGDGWPMQPGPARFHGPELMSTETLVIGGDIDVATPLIFAEAELMPYLPNGRLLKLEDYGHTDHLRQAPAMDQIVARYLDTGVLDVSPLKADPYTFRD